MLMYRDEICHIKGGVGDRVISTKGARLNKLGWGRHSVGMLSVRV